ncbi:MAG: purine-nucleoside phosphorylase [Tissierellia bacterium]|nr:purine-nucleoside phosphorylase [Tissierellia bacterium]
MEDRIKKAADYIFEKTKLSPRIGLVLGSGLGDFAETVEEKEYINYSDIPNFPKSTVAGHKGRFVLGKLNGNSLILMQGRFHFYEGYPMQDLVMPIRVMKLLGVKDLILTNAAGGVNEMYKAGDLMLIEDHLNFTGNNPLIGENLDDFGPRFPDMTNVYSKDLCKIARKAAEENKLILKEGVYAYLTGPSYETPAEIKALRLLGADAVGMSTVPEAIVANHQGMRVLGISAITNMAAGINKTALNHKEVIETADRIKDNFEGLLNSIIGRII